MKFLVLFLLLSQASFAQISTPPLPTEGSPVVPELVKPEDSKFEEVVEGAQPVGQDPVTTKVEKVQKALSNTGDVRGDSTGSVMVGYQLLSTWVPSKKTISYTHIFNRKWALEGEFAFSTLNDPIPGIDLGSIQERRYLLQAQRYVGNSFYFSFGTVLSSFDAELDASVVGQGFSSSFSAQNLGLTFGIGNRWQWTNGVTFGIDWMRANIPVVETRVEDNVLDDIPNAGDREDVKDAIRAFNRIPTFVLFGLNIGYTF